MPLVVVSALWTGIDVTDTFDRSAVGPNWIAWTGHSLSKGLPSIRQAIAQPPQGGLSSSAGLYGGIWVDPFTFDAQEVRFTIARGTDEHYPQIGMFAFLRCSEDSRRYVAFVVADGAVMISRDGSTPVVDPVVTPTPAGTTFVCRAVGHRYTMSVVAGEGETLLVEWIDLAGDVPVGSESRRWGVAVNKQTYGISGFRFSWCVDEIRARDL
ncbi:hypothetical protein [Nocardia sp. NPDC058480]|uniref:DUF7257 domain-containing protein n=1 Tax=unclassified Nocardia TaxID=2637762 RepID=UPI003662E393